MILLTGAAGFIGMHLAARLLESGHDVHGVDDFNAYYSPELKRARIAKLAAHARFAITAMDVADAEAFKAITLRLQPTAVVHLAAQAGVRHSLKAPFAYERANLAGHLSVLEAVRACSTPPALIYASSSSVYGDRPLNADGFKETDPVDNPASLYAATKRAGELMAIAYASLYGLGATALRFFTVYGPWGRPDMAYSIFTERMLMGQPIEVFGEGKLARDFTYIDDIVDGIVGVLNRPAESGQHRIFNIGDSRPITVNAMLGILEEALGRKAQRIERPTQPGDVTATFANIDALNALCGYRPAVPLEEGLRRFVAWRLADGRAYF
jgi:UDP-glucuronate 4-epimerase